MSSGTLEDIKKPFTDWRIWWILGNQDIKLRYRRSFIGPFWISLSMAAMVLGIAFMYSQIFDIDFDEYLAYLSASFLAWYFISGLILEGCQALIEAENQLRASVMSITTLAFRTVHRNIVIMLHNLLVIFVFVLLFGVRPDWTILFLPVAVLVISIFGYGISLIFAPLCLRYRDVAQVVANFVQIMFFLTPIIWMPSQGRLNSIWINANPFHHLAEIMRAPILGYFPSSNTLIIASAIAIITLAFGFLSLHVSRRKVFLWL